MNILLTDFCNRSCPYCFAQGKLKQKPAYITFRNLRRIIAFLKKSKQTRVGIIGGEPTLHPKFDQIIRMILREGVAVQLFSNGLMKQGTAEFLRTINAKKIALLLNINNPESYAKEEWLRLVGVMKTLNRITRLGFTIYRPDFTPDFLLELIHKHGLVKRIRVGMAAPILGAHNRFLPLPERKKVARRIVKFAEQCSASDISLVMDCGFTLCSFTRGELGRLCYANASLMLHCPPVIDVGPDLTVWRCFAISMVSNKKLTDFTSLDQIHDFYNKKFKLFQMTGSTNDCLRCVYLRRGQCGGGCLGHTLKLFDLRAPME